MRNGAVVMRHYRVTLSKQFQITTKLFPEPITQSLSKPKKRKEKKKNLGNKQWKK